MASAAGMLLFGVWLVAALLSDRQPWSQYLVWIPDWSIALALLGLGGLARLAGGRWRAGGVVAALGAVIAASVLVLDLRLTGLLAPKPPAGGLAVAYWNPARARMDGFEPGAVRALGAGFEPDVAVVANPPAGGRINEVAQGLGLGHVLSVQPLHVMSRHPISGWGWTRLGLQTRSRYRAPDGSWRAIDDRGRAMFVVVEAPAGPVTLWIVDLPSDPTVHRMEIARGALRAMGDWTPSATPTRGNGPWGVAPEGWAGPAGFPPPDAIVGDFNIPRGSASLGVLAPGYANAQRWARPGWHFSWPRQVPLLHIDQVLVAPGWRGLGYHLADPGLGMHLSQRVVLVGPPRSADAEQFDLEDQVGAGGDDGG